jgi:PAS domain S-box-containing protein
MSSATLEEFGADLGRAITSVNVPSYVIDRHGIVQWLNPAAEAIVGDARGRPFTELVAPSDRTRARETFVRNLIGAANVTDVGVHVLAPDGEQRRIEVSSTPLHRGHKVVGVFGLIPRADRPARAAAKHAHLTPRQNQVLHLLADGASTAQMAEELHLSAETVRNHVRGVLRALGAKSRLQAVAAAHRAGLLVD